MKKIMIFSQWLARGGVIDNKGYSDRGIGPIGACRAIWTGFLAVFASVLMATPAFAALSIQNAGVSNITATNAIVYGALTGTNGTNPIVTVCWGQSDMSTNMSYWQHTNGLGVLSTGIFSYAASNLSPRTYYYFRLQAADPTNAVWSGASNWITLPRTPTNWPIITNDITLMVDSNGLFKTPSKAKVIAANGLMMPGLSVTGYVSGAITGKVDKTDPAITNYVAFHDGTNGISWFEDGTNIYPVLDPALIVTSQVAALQGCTSAWNQASSDAASATGGVAAINTWTNSVVLTNSADYLSIPLTMTNYTHVPSSSNWFAYDTTTRKASGCVTNSGGGGGGAGDFKADGSVAMSGNLNGGGQLATNFPNLVTTNNSTYMQAVAQAAAALPKTGGTMTGAITMGTNAVVLGTNAIPMYGGVLNGTNGIYWIWKSTNYWILLAP